MQTMKDTLVLAHYYVGAEVQQMADYVGDSLELALKAVNEKPKRIVFAGVRFMAETVKIMLPDTEVILPHTDSTCSLVTQTNLDDLKRWRDKYADHAHIMYVNSSVEMKALADWIVTSRNVDDIVKHEYEKGNKVIFSPDRNMGAYLNYQYGYDMPVYNSVCIVHDAFKEEQVEYMLSEKSGWTDGAKYLIAHPESPLPVLKRANLVGSTSKMLNWVKEFPYNVGTIYVATEDGLLYNMRQVRPELDIRPFESYNGCQCNRCEFMALNTVDLVTDSVKGTAGVKIDYISNDLADRARKPIERMLNFSGGLTCT